jgi:outer membrane protein TolC
MGLTPEAPVLLLQRIAWTDGAFQTPDEAILRNPALSQLRQAYQVAERSLEHEVRKQYPDITIGPGFGVEDGDPRLLFGLALPIPLWNRNQRAVAEAAAARDVARAAYEAAVESLTFELAAAQVRRDAFAAQRTELESVVVPLVEQQEEDVRRIADAGGIDVFLTLETLERRHRARMRLIDARAEEALAAAQIAALVGPPPSHPSQVQETAR